MEIHQFVAGMSYGDAITNQARMLRKIFRSLGHHSEIYSVPRHINPRMRAECSDYRFHGERSSRGNIAILHFSIASAINDYFRGLPDRKIIIYHNITPAKYFRVINERIRDELENGRQELSSFAGVPELSLAVSDFNRREMVELGYKNTGVLPLAIDRKSFSREPAALTLSLYNQKHVRNFLFVGRFVPNKKFEDLILFFNYYNKYVNSDSRLLLVGSYAGTEMYYSYLRSLVLQLGLTTVCLIGHVNFEDLLAYYSASDVFVCMSEHEGFCIPLIEAMHFKIPVLAYKAGAVPETLGGAGVLFTGKKYPEIAEMAELLINDDALRQRVIKKQEERLGDFTEEKMEERVRKIFAEFTGGEL